MPKVRRKLRNDRPIRLLVYCDSHSPFQWNQHSLVQKTFCNCLTSTPSCVNYFDCSEIMNHYWENQQPIWNNAPTFEGDQRSNFFDEQFDLPTTHFFFSENQNTTEYDQIHGANIYGLGNIGPRSNSAVSSRESPRCA